MKSPIKFYLELGIKNLMNRKKENHTKKELRYLSYFLNKNQKILDLGCGFGRFTIPLKKQGFNIVGLDISPHMISLAKKNSRKENQKITFKIGDMRNLPFKKDSFDVLICMWSTFSELTKKRDQIKAINEMKRVLKRLGLVIIEMPILDKKKEKNTVLDYSYEIKGKISNAIIKGIKSCPYYVHDKKTLENLMRITKIKNYRILNESFGGRTRLFLIFYDEK